MQTSRKSFRALSMAQPLRKQIDDILTKLQIEKRKYLGLQRQQIYLRQQIVKYQRQLNDAKLLQPKTRVKENKNNQTNLSINNTDRLYLKTINKISQVKVTIQTHRRQIDKYKKLLKQLKYDIQQTSQSNNNLQVELLKKQQKNQTLKQHLLEYRHLNTRNTDQFKNSLSALHKSSVKQQNNRKKNSVLLNSYNINNKQQQLKVSCKIMSQLNSSQEHHQLQQQIFMTNSIPLIKQRVRILIHSNKQRLKISQNYKKFGQDLQNMFKIMKQYKGREDIQFISDEFVMKQIQLKKIQEYIGKLQNRSMSFNKQLSKINNSHNNLIEQLQSSDNQQNKLSSTHYINLQSDINKIINNLKNKQLQNIKWFKTIGTLLSPLLNAIEFTKSTSDKILGMIEDDYINTNNNNTNNNMNNSINISNNNSMNVLNKSPVKSVNNNKTIPVGIIDEKQIKNNQSIQLMNYDKLKQYAKQYLNSKNDKHN